MAHIKTVWGPLKTTVQKHRVMWSFTGVRSNGEFCRWTLSFYFDTRKYRTKALSKKPNDPGNVDDLFLPEVDRADVKAGPVTPMLRARLKPEHIAQATRGALKLRGRT